MTLIRNLNILEIVLIFVFFFAYLFYLVRLFKSAKILNSKWNVSFFKLFIRSLYFILLIIALLGPSIGEYRKEIKSIGKDIYFLVDISESMNAFDIQPSRLEKTKFELRKIIKAFSSDRLGLILFSSEAFLQCPLTYDHNTLLLFIETLTTNIVSSTSTDFAPALKMALDKHEKGDNPTNKPQSKIIVLISDGEDFGKKAVEAAGEIKAKEIKLFTLGIGSEKGSKIPYLDGFKTDRNGKEVISILNNKALRQLSQITNGRYFEISRKTNDVDRMINAIKQIEGELKNTKEIDTKANKYYYFLLAALLLIILDIMVTARVINI